MRSLDDFEQLVTECDPTATKYKGDVTGNYTTWTPQKTNRLWSEGEIEDEWWNVLIQRFTQDDPDSIVAAIDAKLRESGIIFEYQVDYDKDTEYLVHTFSCIVR